jgi:hypothetical protein
MGLVGLFAGNETAVIGLLQKIRGRILSLFIISMVTSFFLLKATFEGELLLKSTMFFTWSKIICHFIFEGALKLSFNKIPRFISPNNFRSTYPTATESDKY